MVVTMPYFSCYRTGELLAPVLSLAPIDSLTETYDQRFCQELHDVNQATVFVKSFLAAAFQHDLIPKIIGTPRKVATRKHIVSLFPFDTVYYCIFSHEMRFQNPSHKQNVYLLCCSETHASQKLKEELCKNVQQQISH